jgi:hypothetical protein
MITSTIDELNLGREQRVSTVDEIGHKNLGLIEVSYVLFRQDVVDEIGQLLFDESGHTRSPRKWKFQYFFRNVNFCNTVRRIIFMLEG